MGEVWRASHRMLARPAAVKLIRPERVPAQPDGDDSGVLEQSEREAQATAVLRSPHTIEVYDFGVADDGAFYYVMELLDGVDFQTLVEQHGPQPPERVVHLLRQAAHSLHEAHCAGLVHRDVKPANLFLCRYGTDVDFVKVLDFGLVRRSAAFELTTEPVPNESQVVVGTPAFMPPEVAVGDAELDGRTDLYALGCVAYWLLTGKHVFSGGSLHGVMVDHVRTAPDAPSTRSGRPIPEALDRLVLDCLAKEPHDRPPTAAELSRRLSSVAFSEPWTQKRARRWWQERDEVAKLGRPASVRLGEGGVVAPDLSTVQLAAAETERQ